MCLFLNLIMRHSVSYLASSAQLTVKSQCKRQWKKHQLKSIMLLFILALEAILYTLILLASQKSSVHMYGKFLLQEKGTSTLQMRRWWGNVMFGIFICPVSWFLFLPFDLSPLHQIQLITHALLSSVCLLREAASLSRLSLLRTGRVWLLVAEEEPHHWEQCPEWLPTCAPACMQLPVLFSETPSQPPYLSLLTVFHFKEAALGSESLS